MLSRADALGLCAEGTGLAAEQPNIFPEAFPPPSLTDTAFDLDRVVG
ncbi:hypothetical protein [Streptomyces sp. NPDC057545]